jgi:hypothetical protein
MLPISRVKPLGWALFEVLESADMTQIDVNIELLDGYVELLYMHIRWLPESYGAVSDGATDDVEAINDTIDACTAAGGGDVWFRPARLYAILSGPIVLKGGVSLIGKSTSIRQRSTTNDWITCTSISTVHLYPQKIAGFIFVANVYATGVNLRVTAVDARLLVESCSFNQNGFCRGRAVHVQTSSFLWFMLKESHVSWHGPEVGTTSEGPVYISGGEVTLEDVYVQLGANALKDGPILFLEDCYAHLTRVTLDGQFHSAGSDMVYFLELKSVDTVCDVTMEDTTFRGGGTGFDNGFLWSTNVTIRERGTLWRSFAGARFPATLPVLNEGSVLELPAVRFATASDLLSATGYGTVVYNCTKTTTPDIYLPKILFKGQRYTLIAKNSAVSGSWAGAPVFSGFGSLTNSHYPSWAAIAPGNNILHMEFVAVDPTLSGTPSWALVAPG